MATTVRGWVLPSSTRCFRRCAPCAPGCSTTCSSPRRPVGRAWRQPWWVPRPSMPVRWVRPACRCRRRWTTHQRRRCTNRWAGNVTGNSANTTSAFESPGSTIVGNAMLHLASQSPRRRQLLQQLGADFSLLDVEVAEQRAAGELPQDYVSRVARDKARAGLASLGRAADAVVLGADTEVVLDDEVFGKPQDATDAAAMLRRLSGRTHAVISVVWLVGAL